MRRPSRIILSAVIVVFALAFAGTSPAFSAVRKPDAASVIKKASESGYKNTYIASGKTRIRHQGKLLSSAIKLYHEKPDKCRIEYLTPPLRGVVIGSCGGRAWKLDPKLHKLVLSEPKACSRQDDNLHLLLNNYLAEHAGNCKQAGRPAQSILLKSPRGKVEKRLWVDNATYVILRYEDFDSNGRLQTSTAFDSIKYVDDLSDSLFARPENCCKVIKQSPHKPMRSAEVSKAVGFQVKFPRYIPKGYKLEGCRVHECPMKCCGKTAHIRYTDGLKSVSVFETRGKSGGKTPDSCGKSSGPPGSCVMRDCSQGKVARLYSKGMNFVVVGDLSSAELRRIANSLRE